MMCSLQTSAKLPLSRVVEEWYFAINSETDNADDAITRLRTLLVAVIERQRVNINLYSVIE